jgi:hypothetical protein
MRISTHPEAIKHLVKIGMAADISQHIKMVESANESLIDENARLKAEVERLTKAGDAFISVGVKMREMIGDHHWTLEFDRVRTGWCFAAKGVQS